MATEVKSSNVQHTEKPFGLTLKQAVALAAYMKVLTRALDLFEGDTSAAESWLATPCDALGGETPEAQLSTAQGIESVLDLIGRLEHGVVT